MNIYYKNMRNNYEPMHTHQVQESSTKIIYKEYLECKDMHLWFGDKTKVQLTPNNNHWWKIQRTIKSRKLKINGSKCSYISDGIQNSYISGECTSYEKFRIHSI